MKKRLFILIISALATVSVLIGCNSKSNEPADTTDETAQTTVQIEESETQMQTEAETETEVETDNRLSFAPIDEVVYPYIDVVRDYLEAGADADVNDFEFHQKIQAKAIDISWSLTDAQADGYILEIATTSDFSDAEKVELSGSKTSYALKFPLRDTTYYLRLSVPGQEKLGAETSFKTAYLGPRFLDVGGLYQNCRDLGGYKVGNKTVLYNMVIRGSSPDNCVNEKSKTFTNEGNKFLTATVGIKTQLDLRGSTENCGRTTSTFANANYVHVPLTAYAQCFAASQAELYAQAFRLFADPANYPIYFHCAGGADRTGTVAAILLAYLGVSEDEIIQDYVVTSFSPVCYEQAARSRENILTVIEGLNNYVGETLADKARSYLISIGLTQQELFNIRAIMFGESLDGFIHTVDHGVSAVNRFYNTSSGSDFELKLNDVLKVMAVLADGSSIEFTQNAKSIAVKAAGLAGLSDGSHKLKVLFADGESTELAITINVLDLTGDLQVSEFKANGEQTYVYIKASSSVFNGIDWHFHTRRSTLYPDVEPNIKINGKTVAEINDTTDMSAYEWTMSPGSTDSRHRVPVDISATGNTMKLVLRTEWLESYLNGNEMTITICKGFTYTVDGQTYKVDSDITYRYTNGVWVKVV